MAGLRRRALIALLPALGLLALPAAAMAKGKYFVVPAQRYETIQQLRGTHGFRFILTASGKKVYATAEKRVGRNGFVIASYSGERQGPVESGVHLSLGREGRIDLHFVPHKVKEERLSKYCTGTPSVTEEGDFVGAIHLHGLRGFTRIERGGAPGSIYRGGRQVCRRHRELGVFGIGIGVKGKSYVPPGAGVIVGSASAAGPTFEAFAQKTEFGDESFDQTYFSSLITETEGSASVTRSASVFETGEAGLTRPDRLDPTDATTVEPSAPFSGSATFELLSPTQAEWSGDLAVELPGLGEVPLTGPGIEAGFCRSRNCTKTLPPRLSPSS